MVIWRTAALVAACLPLHCIADAPGEDELAILAAATVIESARVAAAPAAALADVPEIPDPALHDVAILRPDPQYGAVIVYNPNTCQLIGPACRFFLTHEHGHLAHHHQPQQSVEQLAAMEAQADCWAAAHASPRAVMAAYYLFMRGGSSPHWEIYGHPQQRAARVRDCALKASNWVGR